MAATEFRSSKGERGGSTAEKRREAVKLLAIKSSGYLISTVSVILLGIVSWKSASEKPLLMVCLIVGMATSVIGMFLRWLSYEIQEHRKADGRE